MASEFMQRVEFIERFRREARAAGRLRHPNVVNVTDFGFANANDGTVAYLVMEYLDGCTLGEILEEEKRLPLSWTIDILEQVCSAVEEAHKQGIIHRDLKPDNIWLEPNQRGGYTVKVLDFGIAKLEEQISDATESTLLNFSTAPTENFRSKTTVADQIQTNTIAENRNRTVVSESATVALNKNSNVINSEAGTLVQPMEAIDSESGTMILPAVQAQTILLREVDDNGTKILPQDENNATKLISEQINTGESSTKSTAELTRVGAVLGTPLYMSPEQCRGEKLSPRSDVYSLGVIAYQMLSGKTPFGGDYKAVLKAHEEIAPPDLEAKKVPKKVKKVISAALAKDSEMRPPTAQSFAAELRAQSEGISTLLRRALEIYGKHLPQFLLLAALLYLPLTILTILQVSVGFFQPSNLTLYAARGFLGLAVAFGSIFCGSILVGTMTWLVTQIMAFPLKPVTLRPALEEARRKWKKLVGTSLLSGFFMIVGLAFCVVPGVILAVIWTLATPVVMMENLRGFAALKRSKNLVKRSLRTTSATILMMFLIPIITSLFIAFFAKAVVREFTPEPDKPAISRASSETSTGETVENRDKDENISINIGTNKGVSIKSDKDETDEGKKLRYAIREALTQVIYLPISIIFVSFFTIVVALLYLKTRQIGGESMQDLLTQFEETDRQRSNWQKSIRQRIEQSGKQTSKS
ncbi:MAG TPA: protein kinase [Pyrinomonadaceae bacterium]|nr:protein kinase [Pyrinomonadaceae bacterium]